MNAYKKTNELILTLLNIKGIGRKTISPFLTNETLKIEQISTVQEGILQFEKYLIDNNKKIKFTDEDIVDAKTKAHCLLDTMINDNVIIIDIFSDYYPIEFSDLGNDRPLMLYTKGNVDLLLQPNKILVIGSRKVNEKTGKIGQRVAQLMAKCGETIVSGLAIGADTYGHVGALMEENGKTIAVLPSPLNNIVPASNKKLAQEILDNNGLLISEYPYGSIATKGTFVERDRLQACLCTGVFVIDTSVSGGTFHAVKLAQNLNKPIGCLSLDYTTLNGNKILISDYKAMQLNGKESINDFCNRCDDFGKEYKATRLKSSHTDDVTKVEQQSLFLVK